MADPVVLDLTGHAAYLSLLLGTTMIARGQMAGWPCRLAGSIVWAVLGWQMGYSSILLWSILFAGIDGYGWWRSRRGA